CGGGPEGRVGIGPAWRAFLDISRAHGCEGFGWGRDLLGRVRPRGGDLHGDARAGDDPRQQAAAPWELAAEGEAPIEGDLDADAVRQRQETRDDADARVLAPDLEVVRPDDHTGRARGRLGEGDAEGADLRLAVRDG